MGKARESTVSRKGGVWQQIDHEELMSLLAGCHEAFIRIRPTSCDRSPSFIPLLAHDAPPTAPEPGKYTASDLRLGSCRGCFSLVPSPWQFWPSVMSSSKTALKAAKAALDGHKYDEAAKQAQKVLEIDSNNYHAFASPVRLLPHG
jgi:hypothetical protein